jgi:hypothetical protein
MAQGLIANPETISARDFGREQKSGLAKNLTSWS